jgi:hypothetical protein
MPAAFCRVGSPARDEIKRQKAVTRKKIKEVDGSQKK